MQHRGKRLANEWWNKMKSLTYLLPSKTCKNTISVRLQHCLPTLIDNKSHLPHQTPVFIALPALLHNSLEEPRTEKESGAGREETVAAPLTSYQRGETQWLRSQQPLASCCSFSPLPLSLPSSRFPPPSRFLALFLCQIVLSRLAPFSLACSTVPSLSLSPPSSLILLFSVHCLLSLFFFLALI